MVIKKRDFPKSEFKKTNILSGQDMGRTQSNIPYFFENTKAGLFSINQTGSVVYLNIKNDD